MWWRGRKYMLTAQRKASKCYALCWFYCSWNFLFFTLYCDEGGRRIVQLFLYDFDIIVVFAHAVAMIVGSLSWSSWISSLSQAACFVSPTLTCGNYMRNALPTKFVTSPLRHYNPHSQSLHFICVHSHPPWTTGMHAFEKCGHSSMNTAYELPVFHGKHGCVLL